ncbi:MAG: DUF4296 domain-containing protein [Cryomorphaceae bacterium]
MRILVVLIMALFFGCGQKTPPPRKVPSSVLSKDSMAYFLSQVHIVDAAMRHRDVRKENLQVYAKRGFIEYFDTAQVNRERFLESLAFWGEDFEEMSGIYDMAMERLSTQMARLKMEEKKAVSDAKSR